MKVYDSNFKDNCPCARTHNSKMSGSNGAYCSYLLNYSFSYHDAATSKASLSFEH